MAMARRVGGESAQPVSVRMLRNKTSLAPLGCAVVTCRSRADADLLAAKLDGHGVGRKTVRARADLDELGAVAVSPHTSRAKLPAFEVLKPFLEQVGDLVGLDKVYASNTALATFGDGASAVAAVAVLDGAVVGGVAVRIEERRRTPPQPKALLEAGCCETPPSSRSCVVFSDVMDERTPRLESLAPLSFESTSGEEWGLGVWRSAATVCKALGLAIDVSPRDVAVVATPRGGGRGSSSLVRATIEAPHRAPLEAVRRVDEVNGGALVFVFDGDKAADYACKDKTLKVVMREDEIAESCGSTARVASERTPDSPEASVFFSADDDKTLGAALFKAWQDDVATDCAITCEDGVVVKAHRVVLAARSAFFRQHFVDRDGADLLLNAEPSRLVEAFCCFAYADALVGRYADVLKDPRDAIALLDLAARYELDGLPEYLARRLNPALHDLAAKKPAKQPVHPPAARALDKLREDADVLCVKAAEEHPDLARFYLRTRPRDHLTPHLEAKATADLSPQNLAHVFDLAHALNSDTVRRACLDFAKQNIHTVMTQPAFTKLLHARKDLVFELLADLDNGTPARDSSS